ncbi:16S ribosomal RNA methyltransferase KsgA/Dim1 family protein [Novipirellula aureliae]|uniref:16S ribosomal RNA methyltransferase KsgA/Dim1 family protein n=1 Tax=Novipirellula aureliae TaxID=2527966 RepID=A0A5C6EEA7_9BACT|nr:rRNA adenine N-6-methyltransferase family protein [Novipirellula aureliae]TWU46061.1 16S ribosomal RNA methyltransferase KsgA/Dim1 family protein [Novipirellula aureliae]
MSTHAARFRSRNYWNCAAAVFQEWLREPTQVASVVPSSPVLLNQIVDRDCIKTASSIIDLGPGTGGTTEAILDRANDTCRVLAIEKTEGFIEPLRSIDDARLTIEHGDVIELERILLAHDVRSPDVILSGIPFSSLSPDAAASIMQSIHRVLASDGTFIAYQLRNDVARYAEKHFGTPESTEMVWLNIPPLTIYTWRKNGPY